MKLNNFNSYIFIIAVVFLSSPVTCDALPHPLKHAS